jgi:hypothetical protein
MLSSCWATRITTAIATAPPVPTAASVTSTITTPDTHAPRIGMNSDTKLSSASVPTCGGPITSMPSVITVLSISATSAIPRI